MVTIPSFTVSFRLHYVILICTRTFLPNSSAALWQLSFILYDSPTDILPSHVHLLFFPV